MVKVINFLSKNLEILELWKANQVSIIGVHTEEEKQAILAAFQENDNIRKAVFWK